MPPSSTSAPTGMPKRRKGSRRPSVFSGISRTAILRRGPHAPPAILRTISAGRRRRSPCSGPQESWPATRGAGPMRRTTSPMRRSTAGGSTSRRASSTTRSPVMPRSTTRRGTSGPREPDRSLPAGRRSGGGAPRPRAGPRARARRGACPPDPVRDPVAAGARTARRRPRGGRGGIPRSAVAAWL